MKTIKNLALFGAIALTSMLSLSACSSSEDAIDNPDYNPEDNTVKTEFTISLPANVKTATTRMASSEVPDNNTFRGMENIILIPFNVAGTIKSSSTRFGDNIVLPATTAGGTANTIESTGLNTGNNSKVFNDVTIPIGTRSFLLYGKAIDGSIGATLSTDADFHKYGYLTPPTFTNEPSTFTFGLKQIAAGTSEKASAIVSYLNAIAGANYDDTETPANNHKWSETTDVVLKALYDAFISNKAGSSNSIKLIVADLYNSLWQNTDDMSKAIVTAIKTKCSVPSTENGTISSWDSSIEGYPGDINLPDGAAAVTFTSGSFAQANGTIYNTSELSSYTYPASLYYFVNSQIKTATSSKATEYSSGSNSTWQSVLDKYNETDNTAVVPNTRSVAIVSPINYAVARFDATVKKQFHKLFDYNGDPIFESDTTSTTVGFPIKAVLIGSQNSVDFTFKPSAEGTNIIYDNAVATGTNATTSPSTANRTMVLETVADQNVKVVIELENNVADFYGKDGQLIKKDSKFYLLGTLSASAADTETGKLVFKQDFVTTANFTIKQGTAKENLAAGAHNNIGLGAAYNVIPDLRNPQLELGMSVDLSWESGHVYDIVI
ncbi:MAG: hypothetical protein IJ580_06145 [Prevotella sp.]|nr:hypothetical protein [Prevotella sp.]